MQTKEVKKSDNISQAIEKNPKAAEILFDAGLFCAGCHAAQFETIEQGCAVHGIDADEVIKKINAGKKNKKRKVARKKTTKKKEKSINL